MNAPFVQIAVCCHPEDHDLAGTLYALDRDGTVYYRRFARGSDPETWVAITGRREYPPDPWDAPDEEPPVNEHGVQLNPEGC